MKQEPTMSQTNYYVRLGMQLMGPFSLDQLRALKDRGRLQPFHSISTDGRTWQPASTLTELFPPEPQAQVAAHGAGQAPSPLPSVSPPSESWYYMDSQGNQVGPVSQAKLLELVAAGEVLPTTYVWTVGLTEWKPLKEVLPGLGNLIGKQARQPLGANFKPLAWVLAAVMGLVIVIAGVYFFATSDDGMRDIARVAEKPGNDPGAQKPNGQPGGEKSGTDPSAQKPNGQPGGEKSGTDPSAQKPNGQPGGGKSGTHTDGEKPGRPQRFYYIDEAGNKSEPVTELELRKLRDRGDLADNSPVFPENGDRSHLLAEVLKPEKFDPEKLFAQVFRGAPMLFSFGPKRVGHGSGFVVNTYQKRKGIRWFIVTNRHVVEGLQEALGEPMAIPPYQPKWSVIFFERIDGTTRGYPPKDGLEVCAIHPKADLAIIECTRIKNWLKDRQVHAFRLAPRDLELKPGTEVVVIGHPGNPGAGGAPEPMTYTRGHIAGPERVIEGCRFHQLQVPLAPGNSGGPVLDMTGQVVGIVTLGAALRNQGQFNYALHVKYLHELLDSIP
jgi:S1-C subfamily serine protease